MGRDRPLTVRSAQAEELARQKFLERYAGRTIPDDVVARLGRSIGAEGKYWTVSICLYEGDPRVGAAGLTEDLMHPPPKVLVIIRVDGETGETVLEELADVPW